jgi:tetratricopeptide (TPR) repeat protein/DNA-binding beta-propeller fold protein YncE
MKRFSSPSIDDIAEEDENIRQHIRNAESNPSDYESWNTLAKRLLEEEYYNPALICYDKAIEINPNNIDSWYNKGRALSNLGKYDEAILCYDKVINIDPDHIYAWNSKGYALNYLGKFPEAIKSYNRVIQINADNVTAWYNRGLALSNLGKYDEAIKSYDRVLEIDANNTDALNAKGLALERLGKYDEAMQYYSKVTEIYAFKVKTNNEKGNFLQESGKFREAIKSYDRVLEIDANNINALNAKGLALERLGKYDEAIKSYDRVLEIDANNTDALYNKANLHISRGKYDEAIKSYDRVLEIDANNTDVLYKKAHLMISLDKYDEAAGVFKKIIDSNPANISALESLHELYSNKTFEFDKSLSIAKKLYDMENEPDKKTRKKIVLAEDFIKTGKYSKGIELALEAKRESLSSKIRRQSIIRFLMLSSYLLEGNSIRGSKQLVDFLNYYKELEDFEIDEKEWNFSGLIKVITSSSIKPHTKRILMDLIDLLRGKGHKDKILARLATNISDISLQITRRTSTRLKVLVPIIFTAVAIPLIILLVWYISMINDEKCSIAGATLNIRGEGVPVDIAVNPNTDIVYVANSNSKNILAIDCNKQKIMVDAIPTNGIVRELTVDPTSNKVYAALRDNKSALVIDSSNELNTGIDDINEAVNDLVKGEFDEVLYDSPDHSSPTAIKTSAMPVAVDPNPNSGNVYIANNTSNTIHKIDNDNKVEADTSLKNTTLQDIVFNPTTGKIYAAYNKSGIISVTNSKNGTVLKDIPGAGAAIGINSLIVNPNTNKIYVINPTLQKISVIDGKKDSVKENIPVGIVPIDMAIDSSNNMIYVAHQISNTISIIDGNKDEVVQILQIPFGNNVIPNSIAVNSKTHILYLGFIHDDGSQSVGMLDPATNNDTYIQVAERPLDLEFNVNNSKLYVAEYNNGSIAIIDTNANNTLLDDDVNLGQNRLPFSIAVNPNTNKVYVANFVLGNNNSSIVSVIDGKDSNVLKDVSIPFRVSEMAVNTNSNKIYVVGSNNNYNYLSIIDGQNYSILNDISIPFIPSDIAVNPNTNKIYLANNNNWSVTVINDKGNNVLDNSTIKLGMPPESIVVDPDPKINRIYVTSYTKPNSAKDENSFDPITFAIARLTQIQMIDGSNDTVGWDGKILNLDPKYGDLILTFNPDNHNFLATSLSTDTVLSWDINKSEKAVASGRPLSGIKQIPAGIDPSQLTMNLKGDKLYIANQILNAIKVEYKAFESSK